MLRRLSPYLTLAILAALAAEPLARPLLICSDDGAFHLFRAVELGALLQMGQWFPRWAPHMAQGYGFPFYNFYAPLSSYFVVALHALPGLTYTLALKLAFGLGLWASGVTMFWFVRALTRNTLASLVAGFAYLFTPYLAYDLLYRANFAESFAFVWPPLVLLGLHKIANSAWPLADSQPPSPPPSLITHYHPLLTAFSYAALILTHNIFAFIASPLFAGYALLAASQRRSWRSLFLSALALGLGIALTTYFWLPALAERSLVHSDRLFVPPIFTWYTNFIQPSELFALPFPEDPALLNPSPPRALGLLVLLLALPAFFAFFKRKSSSHSNPIPNPQLLFFFLALCAYAALTLEISKPLWQLLSPLALVQFPWRMLGPAALCTAVLVGLGLAQLQNFTPLRPFILPCALGLIFLANLGWWYPRYCAPDTAESGIPELLRYERATNTLGTTAKGEYLPLTADYLPAETDLAQALESGTEPDRLILTPPADSNVNSFSNSPLFATYQLTLTQPTTLTYRQFLYPGWQATVNGQPQPLTPTPGTGLITFALPPGVHTVQIQFGPTPLRLAASAVSIFVLGLLILGIVLALRRVRAPAPASAAQPASRAAPLAAVAVALALLLLKVGLIDRTPNPLRQAQSRLHPQTPLPLNFTGGLALSGYDLSATTTPADTPIDVALYAALRAPTDRRYWPALVVEDSQGLVWQDPGMLPPRWHREPPHTPYWPLDTYAQWARHLSLLPGTPPGQYTLWGNLFDIDSLATQSLLGENGSPLAPRFALGSLTLTRPQQPWAITPQIPLTTTFGPITLLGYHLERPSATVGESVLLTLYWRCTDYTPDLTAQLALVDPSGQAVWGLPLAPVATYPTSLWQPGDAWRGQHRLRLPAALPPGDYQLQLTLGTLTQTLGHFSVFAPTRTFTAPAWQTPNGATFNDVGVLAGYTLTPTASALQLALIWHATASPLTSYSVFVHLAAPDGRVWAQSDNVPAQWVRPTTGWLPGEYIVDSHTLALPPDLPAGDYQLFIGLYDPITGQRVLITGPGTQPDQRLLLQTIVWP